MDDTERENIQSHIENVEGYVKTVKGWLDQDQDSWGILDKAKETWGEEHPWYKALLEIAMQGEDTRLPVLPRGTKQGDKGGGENQPAEKSAG